MPFDPYRGCSCDGCMDGLSPERREEYLDFRSATQARREATRLAQIAEQAAEQARLDEVIQCTNCDLDHQRRDMLTVDGGEFCHDCAATCSRCDRAQRRTELRSMVSGSWGNRTLLCSACIEGCEECEEEYGRADMIRVNGSMYCNDCVNYCDDCDRYYVGDCTRCEGRLRGLGSYGKTYANRWLGGPVPKDKKGFDTGYYIGFELEISASSGNAQVVNDWAAEHLEYRDSVDCKEDSSVDGFEIATQPMTPEYFEKVNWESFFDLLNAKFPIDDDEPREHGLHVHIGRAAFARDDIAMAAFCYLIGQGDHLVRIGRRQPTSYCKKVDKPVSATIKRANSETGRHQAQASKRSMRDIYPDRDAINLMNGSTIEIRAFRSTRLADDLRDAVRLVYVAAEYVRHLRSLGGYVSPRALHWEMFAKWVGTNHPEAFASIAGITDKKVVKG